MFEIPEAPTVAQSVVETPLPSPPTPSTPAPLDVGEMVWVVFWRSFPIPGNTGNGTWEVSTGNVISAGKFICVLLTGSLPAWMGGAWEAPAMESPRFVHPDRVFRTQEEAQNVASSLKPQ